MKKENWHIEAKTKIQAFESLAFVNLEYIFRFMNDNFNCKKHVIEYSYGFCGKEGWIDITIRNKTKEEKSEEI